ncbi:MAG: toxin-antitoxin system HicB family antitoxin [Planctomycetota bacterium]|nr:MAG: toxin-antitoxin system HicB family antitoxin [Planctomycetota bacterium]REJ93139.1 MAG: toxin-antitoxin system HicB family antitoxin [Planctomycetota bacterium]REK21829.1 MAG: toxin-antitoxin system HicB family antitoxin [Planctomycetota bacterium]REK37629.1 MAG: toxin-antitoxin system HicB family antitoxin [Planctomycetota bacterium]
MSTLSLRLPDSVHKKVRELAKQEGISINQFIASATAEKLAALLTAEYLEERGQRGSRKEYEKVLQKVKSRPPQPGDELPDE